MIVERKGRIAIGLMTMMTDDCTLDLDTCGTWNNRNLLLLSLNPCENVTG